VDRKRLANLLNFACDPALEQQIETLAVKDQQFWMAHKDLLQPEFFGNQLAGLLMTLVHFHEEFYHSVPDHTVLRDMAIALPQVPDNLRQPLLQHIDTVFSSPPTNSVYLSARVQELGRKRALRAAVVRVAELNESTNDDSALDTIQDVMSAALSMSVSDPNPVVSVKSNYHTILNWCSSSQDEAVATMLPSVDRMLRGGILPGELGVILAPPNRGKSLVLVNLGCGAQAAGNTVLFISNEDGVKGIGPRVLSRMTGIPVNDLGSKSQQVERELKTLFKMFNTDFRIVYRTPMRTGVQDIRALLDQLENNSHFKPKVVIIDYADRLKPAKKRKEKWDELVDIYIDLKALAEEKHIAIWTASQSNREGFAKDILDLDNTAGAFQKTGEADIVGAYCQSPEEREAGEARIHWAKLRNRASGSITHIYVDRARSTITEVPVDKIPALVSTRRKKGSGGGGAVPTQGACGGTTPAPVVPSSPPGPQAFPGSVPTKKGP
jgi:archaellum biogenesis ATPase FlaH